MEFVGYFTTLTRSPCRDISGPEYEGQMAHVPFFCMQNQDFDGPFGKNDGPKNRNIHLTAN